jgi:hypothetical protein
MQPVTAELAHKTVEEVASKPDRDVRRIESLKVGQGIRQGDIYIRRVRKADVPSTKPYGTTQLAPGNTQGSRHVVQGDVELRKPSDEKDPLQGPFILAEERFEIVHPEHAHFSLPPGAYQATYQRDYAKEEVARVQD